MENGQLKITTELLQQRHQVDQQKLEHVYNEFELQKKQFNEFQEKSTLNRKRENNEVSNANFQLQNQKLKIEELDHEIMSLNNMLSLHKKKLKDNQIEMNKLKFELESKDKTIEELQKESSDSNSIKFETKKYKEEIDRLNRLLAEKEQEIVEIKNKKEQTVRSEVMEEPNFNRSTIELFKQTLIDDLNGKVKFYEGVLENKKETINKQNIEISELKSKIHSEAENLQQKMLHSAFSKIKQDKFNERNPKIDEDEKEAFEDHSQNDQLNNEFNRIMDKYGLEIYLSEKKINTEGNEQKEQLHLESLMRMPKKEQQDSQRSLLSNNPINDNQVSLKNNHKFFGQKRNISSNLTESEKHLKVNRQFKAYNDEIYNNEINFRGDVLAQKKFEEVIIELKRFEEENSYLQNNIENFKNLHSDEITKLEGVPN